MRSTQRFTQKSTQKGFTLLELIIVIAMLGAISFGGFMVYAACHFIAKFW
jgi:prepilin-type N-terminal cleavage/methylation domain-containing protein